MAALFSQDSILAIPAVGKDWRGLVQHEVPYARKYNRRKEHKEHHLTPPSGGATEGKDGGKENTGNLEPSGFETIV